MQDYTVDQGILLEEDQTKRQLVGLLVKHPYSLIYEALERAIKMYARHVWGYMLKILNDWEKWGLKNIDDVNHKDPWIDPEVKEAPIASNFYIPMDGPWN